MHKMLSEMFPRIALVSSRVKVFASMLKLVKNMHRKKTQVSNTNTFIIIIYFARYIISIIE